MTQLLLENLLSFGDSSVPFRIRPTEETPSWGFRVYKGFRV